MKRRYLICLALAGLPGCATMSDYCERKPVVCVTATEAVVAVGLVALGSSILKHDSVAVHQYSAPAPINPCAGNPACAQ
jgi:hypothetical protein